MIKYKGIEYKDNKGFVSLNGKEYQVINDINQITLKKENIGHYCKSYFFNIQININDLIKDDIKKCAGNMCSGHIENVYFDDCIFNENVGYEIVSKQSQTTIPKTLSFGYSEFVKELLIDYQPINTSIEDTKIEFIKCHIGNKFKIRNYETQYFEGKPIPPKDRYEHYQQHKTKIKELRIIDCTVGNDAYLRIGFLEVANFELSNLRNPQNAELNIGDCYFQCFKLTNFRNIGKFKLFKINILDKEKTDNLKFQIDNTSIGQADFQGLNLASFDRVIMFDNIFSNIDYTNVQWKNEIEVGQCQDEEKAILEKKQDTYRTLKNVAQKNNDQPQALIFYAEEMKYYRRIVKGNTDYSWSDKVTLWFNKYTNNFGLNWWRPLFGLIIISIVAYLGLLLALEMPISVCGHWGKIFVFLNPTHKVEFIGSGWDGWTYGIDLVFRIIEGLLIYQTIQAFRKYSRKL